jgi:hypothetical protein
MIDGELVGFAVGVFTFPGVVVHEFAHMLFCKLTGVRVLAVSYLELDGGRLGYVRHEPPSRPWQTFIISTGPFVVNSLAGVLVGVPAMVLRFPRAEANWMLLWLGVSIAMHAFPSQQDASQAWRSLHDDDAPEWFRVVALPFLGLTYVGSILSRYWFDAFYAFILLTVVSYLFSDNPGAFIWE